MNKTSRKKKGNNKTRNEMRQFMAAKACAIDVKLMLFTVTMKATSTPTVLMSFIFKFQKHQTRCSRCKIHGFVINPLKPELNPICYLLALLAHHFPHVSRIRVKSLTIRLLMSYIYMEHLFLMFLDHTQRSSTVGRTPLDE